MNEIQTQLNAFARKGGKKSRRRYVARIKQLINFCKTNYGIRNEAQIGRAQLLAWLAEKPRGQPLSPLTLRDRGYAADLLWELLGRGNKAPRL
jgi:hypothetical protein